MTTLKGTINSIRYQNKENAWAAVILNTAAGKTIVASGIMPGIKIGMAVKLEGEYKNTKWGMQFEATAFEEDRPSDIEGIYKYLASGLIKNIGPVNAQKIVNTFGEQTLDVLDNAPERLREVRGIGPKRIKSIIEADREQKAIRAIMIWLKRYDLPNGLAAKIYKTYGDNSVGVLEENPYRLADDIKGVGFKKADAVAMLLGIPPDSHFRLLSGLKACLEDWAAAGNTYMPCDMLILKASSEDYMNIDPEPVADILESGEFFSVGQTEDGRAYLPAYYYAEKKIAERLSAILRNGRKDTSVPPDYSRIQKETGFSFSSQQKLAIATAISSSMMIMTGGPGTGKTTTTNAIINECESRGYEVVLAAPTGRAAKRMNETSGRPSQTIHRLLEYQQGSFTRNELNPIDGDVIIIDEASMIDTLLMKDLLKAISNKTKLIIVGDTDQLPSVGAGSVLRDLIASGTIPTVTLTEIYRQAQGSDIIMSAHSVNHGYMPRMQNRPGTDFWFFNIEDKDQVADTIVELVKEKIPNKFGFSADDIQVLSPMRRDWDPIGSTVLNGRLQEALNADGEKAASRGFTQFRIGDRVMQTKNNYDKDIFNGDIGTVTAKLSGEDEDEAIMEADFEGRIVRFAQGDLDELELAYACTIHKSQGSEYPVVVIPVHSSQFIMLKRNLLYTGITRAKKQCILVGTAKAIHTAVSRPDTETRFTTLQQRLQETI